MPMQPRTISAIAAKSLEMRETLWPGSEPELWNRKINKGFATIPKTMPLILKIIDELTKGAPAGSTYLALWCATFDNSFVNLSKPNELAYASGFGGQRDRHTWAGRMKKLKELGFIDIKPGKAGPMSFAIIWNPHYAIRALHEAKTPGLMEGSFNGLLEHAMEIGAKDMQGRPPPAPAPSPPAATDWAALLGTKVGGPSPAPAPPTAAEAFGSPATPPGAVPPPPSPPEAFPATDAGALEPPKGT